MKGPEKPGDRFEGLSEEQRQYLEELADTIGGDEGKLAVEHERLGMLLTGALGELDAETYGNVCQMVLGDASVPDAEALVTGSLMAPEDSPSRTKLIEYLLGEPNTRKIVGPLRDMERFLSKNA